MRALGLQSADQASDIVGEPIDVVGVYAGRLGRQVIAAQIGSDHPKTGRCQRRNLVAPGVPMLGKAMQQDDQRLVAKLDVVQSKVAKLGVAMDA